MPRLLKHTLVVTLLLVGSATAFGQAISGDLVGIVKDTSGALVANANVEVTNLGTAQKQTTTTNNNGEYRFVNLPAGHYSVDATTTGLKGGYADVEVQLNHTAT